MNYNHFKNTGVAMVTAGLVIIGALAGCDDGSSGSQGSSAPEPGSPEANKRVFMRQCKTCHTAEQNGKHKAGPNLWGIAGGDIGARAGYRYSKAMKEAGGKWDDKKLDKFIASPRHAMPGTKMIFKGLGGTKDRKAIIAFLNGQTEKKATPQ